MIIKGRNHGQGRIVGSNGVDISLWHMLGSMLTTPSPCILNICISLINGKIWEKKMNIIPWQDF